MKILRNNQGFTLMEMLVVVAIFSFVTIIISNIYVSTSRSQRFLLNQQKLQSDARYSMEIVAQAARTYAIDYSYYGGEIVLPLGVFWVDVLALKDEDGNQILFRKSDVGCPVDADFCLQQFKNGWPDWKNISPEGSSVTDLKFIVYPHKDPFIYDDMTVSYLADNQPRVTIMFIVENITDNEREKTSIHLQTMVSSRIYTR